MNDKELGNYRIVREIGSGGMGIVYLCERSDGTFNKPVAIKISRSGSEDPEAKQRLVKEGWILSQLDHENICRFIDIGVSSSGHILLVMEYIEGLPIDRFCNERGLSVAERLALFRQVCCAVDYVHSRPLMHLDLKPSNIYVTHEGVVKLLDFGTAVMVDRMRAPVAKRNHIADYLTLEYASPEVIRGDNVSTLSDQYSLGVVLYELLTGHKPFNVADKMSMEIYRVICEEAPPAPSHVVRTAKELLISDGQRILVTQDQISNARGVTPAALQKILKDDLDHVLLMALRKEPERRYQTVESFEQDIKRYLEKRPLIAKKDSIIYRFSRFAKHQPFLLLTIIFITWLTIVQLTLRMQTLGKSEALAKKAAIYGDLVSSYLNAVQQVSQGKQSYLNRPDCINSPETPRQ